MGRSSFYKDKRVIVTGANGFIGSHLVERLCKLGAIVTGVDLEDYRMIDLKRYNNFDYVVGDVRNYDLNRLIFRHQDIVFHLAYVVGGRGFIEWHQSRCGENFIINHNVFKACVDAGVDRVFYASSACVYPNHLQDQYDSPYLLKEEDALLTSPSNYDTIYGWSKLTGELELRAFYKEYGLKSSIARFVTVYGPREDLSHAIPALMNRAIRREDPYIVWGSGEQDRDFTYVSDIIDGILLLTEKVTDATPVNLGTGVKTKIRDLVEMILRITKHKPSKIVYDTSKPEGVKSRGLDISKARELGYEPKVSLYQGLVKLYNWFTRK